MEILQSIARETLQSIAWAKVISESIVWGKIPFYPEEFEITDCSAMEDALRTDLSAETFS